MSRQKRLFHFSMHLPLSIYILLISFLAALIRSTFGFGEALVAVPLLALRLPIQIAVPLAVMLSIAIALIVVVQDHQHIHIQSAKWLILSALPGIPLGLYLMLHLNEEVTKILLGLLIISFALYSILKKSRPSRNRKHKKQRSWLLFACGLLSGILGGAYGLNGPPLVYYGDSQGWSAKHFRATLQAYFLPASTLALVGYCITSMISGTLLYYFIIALPAAIPAIYIGRAFNKKFTTNAFFRVVYFFLLFLGGLLLYNSFQ